MSNFLYPLSNLTDDHKAIILLCSHLQNSESSPKTLSVGEYNKVVQGLMKENKSPKDLFQEAVQIEIAKFTQIDVFRLKSLLDRNYDFAFTLEKWQNCGIWILTRIDKAYPHRYKKHLKEKAPPLLYGIGNQGLLNGYHNLGIVGSRDIDDESKEFTSEIGKFCANNRLLVVSGGAKGVDQISMLSTLDAGGASIGVLSDQLLQKSLNSQYLQYILEGRLTLISPYYPEMKFQDWAAMERNKHIYTLSDYVLVVHSKYQKGGTWAGAVEELKRKKIPVFARIGKDTLVANQKLVDEYGAYPWPQMIEPSLLEQLNQIIISKNKIESQKTQISIQETLFTYQEQLTSIQETLTPIQETLTPIQETLTPIQETLAPIQETLAPIEPIPTKDIAYITMLPVILDMINELTVDELISKLGMISSAKKQVEKWLEEAETDDKIIKYSSNPKIYLKTLDLELIFDITNYFTFNQIHEKYNHRFSAKQIQNLIDIAVKKGMIEKKKEKNKIFYIKK